MNKLNSIYVSLLALVVAIASAVMCFMNCQNSNSVDVEQTLLDKPEIIVKAMQKYEENMQTIFPIKPLVKSGDLIYKDGYIYINPKKLYVMNEILLKLI